MNEKSNFVEWLSDELFSTFEVTPDEDDGENDGFGICKEDPEIQRKFGETADKFILLKGYFYL